MTKPRRKRSRPPGWHPPRRRRPAPPGPTPGKGPFFWASYGLVFVVLVWLNPPPRIVALPQQLEGVWRTDMPRYASRRFIIASDMMMFQTADDSASIVRYFVIEVRKSRYKNGGVSYSVDYTEDGSRQAPLTLDILFFAGPPAQIQFRNQLDVVWQRAELARND